MYKHAASPPVTYSSTRGTQYTLETTNYPFLSISSNIPAPTNKSTRPPSTSSPQALRLYLKVSAVALQPESSSWNVFIVVNMTLDIQFMVPNAIPRKLHVVRLRDQQATRFQVNLTRRTIRIEKVQLSDHGLYRVVAWYGKKRVKSDFRIIVEEDSGLSSSSANPTTTAPTMTGSVSRHRTDRRDGK